MSNPNFPKNLDIKPSISSFSSGVGSTDSYGHESQLRDIKKYGIAGRVWEAAYVLGIYVNPPPNIVFDPPFRRVGCATEALTMIELGAGSGMVGLSIARSLKPHQDTIILTDLPEVCPLLQKNLEREPDIISHKVVNIEPLSWGNSDHAACLASRVFKQSSRTPRQLTHILCSDLVYFPELLSPLLRTLIQISSPPFADCNSPPDLIISYKIRSLSKETPFWSAFGLWFSFEPVLVKDLDAGSSWKRFGEALEGPTFVFVAHRRPESFGWTVVPDDKDLLAGVGARGTMHCKGDDTFETLLFMMMEEADDNDHP